MEEVSIKVIKKRKLSKERTDELLNEVKIRLKLSHRCIQKFFGAYEDEKRFFHVYELVKGGDLTDSLNTSYELSERNVQ
jgi:serine/threonine protein kinase